MRRFTGSTAMKITVFFLLFLSMIGILVSFIGTVILYKEDAYFDGGRTFRNDAIDEAVASYESHLSLYAEAVMTPDNTAFDQYVFEDIYGEENCNYYFTLYDETGAVVLTNYSPDPTEGSLREYGSRPLVVYFIDYNDQITIVGEYEEIPTGYTIVNSYWDEDGRQYMECCREYVYELTLVAGVRANAFAKDRIYYSTLYVEWLINNRYLLASLVPILAVGIILLIVFLVCAAGHHRGEENARPNFIDRIPLDVYLAGLVALILGLIWLAYNVFYNNDLIEIGLCIIAVPLTLSILLTVATRIKTGTLLSNLLITKGFRLLYKCCRKAFAAMYQLPLYWTAGVVWLGFLFTELILFIIARAGILLLFWLLQAVLITPLLIWVVVQLQSLRKAGKELASGNIAYTVDTVGMLPVLKEHGEHLNGIGEGLKVAVDKGVRSERMRAELITNVSHDIKTPLTSIVNYVNLLKVEGLDGENASEYVEILERQAARLKKLTEDLIEASKASTGAVRVQIAPLDAHILLQQATAEFTDKLSARQLTLLTQFTDEPAYILADGRLLWRVFDNLLSNIVKYAKSDTRVYLITAVEHERVVITFKNISGEALNISPDELSERFVRGDASRNTEGSGLGLSIAKSLTELQGGTFDIVIDGDLFKTVITLPEAHDEH